MGTDRIDREQAITELHDDAERWCKLIRSTLDITARTKGI